MTKVERHRTAIQRNQLSRPVLVALRDEVLIPGYSFFDFGCGKGQDVEYLSEMGFTANGWDPVHSPEVEKSRADVVNLGYVINVIECQKERQKVLRDAFSLAQRVLVVSAMVGFRNRALRKTETLGDGVLTQRGTFQRYFDQVELGEYISSVLKTDVYPAAQGVFYVFASEDSEQQYCRMVTTEPEELGSHSVLDTIKIGRDDLNKIGRMVETFRRLPMPSEMPEVGLVLGLLASSDDWLQRLSSVLETDTSKSIRRERREDLLAAIASSFYSAEGGLRLSDLSLTQRADVRAIFGSMARAQSEAERYLNSILLPETLETECREWGRGKVTPTALYFHHELAVELPFNLRVITECARCLAGSQLDGTENILKINFRKAGVSFAVYRDFDSDPHPQLIRATRADFASSTVTSRNYQDSKSPPILHRKELFISGDHPNVESWSKFTQEEDRLGLLGRRDIGTLGSWRRVLGSFGVVIEGTTLSQGAPYEVECDFELGPEDEEDFEVALQNSIKARTTRPNKPKQSDVWKDEELDLLAQELMVRGRLPLEKECLLTERVLRKFQKSLNWESLLGERFDSDRFEYIRRERWKHWVVYLGAARFGVTGRPRLNQLDASARADIKCFFQSYRQACAEADQWLLKIGQEQEVANALNTYPRGLHHPEKGLYLHRSLQEDLPVVLQLLLVCARVMAGRSMPQNMTVARIAPDGKNVKFYEYSNFEIPGPATRLQSVKVDFRRRRVVPRDCFHPPKQIWQRADMMSQSHPVYQTLKTFEVELEARLLSQQNPA